MPRHRNRVATLAAWLSVLALVLIAPRWASAYDAAHDAEYRAIAIAEDERELDGLTEYLHADDAGVRRRAVLAVGRLQDTTTVETLIGMLDDPDLGVRHEVIFALGQIGDASAREALEGELDDPDEGVLMLALEALGKLGDKAASDTVAGFLGYPSPKLRGTAAVALWRLADSTAVTALLDHHDDPDPDVRWRVLYALERTVMPDRIVLIAALHLDDQDARVRAHAARTLGRQQSLRGTAYLTQMFGDTDPKVIVEALRGLQRIADSTCSVCAREVLEPLHNGHPYLRATAATVLGQPAMLASTDDDLRKAVVDSLTAHLGDSDAATRAAAAGALLSIRGEAALDQVEPLLADSSVYVRAGVLEALGTQPAARVTPILMKRLAPGTSLDERMTAALTLGTMKAPEALETLRAGLDDAELLYVAAVAIALGQLGDSASVPALAAAYAARAGDADADARIAIHDALATLSGAAFADSVAAAHPAAKTEPRDYPADFQKPPAVKGAILQTTAGEIEWAFYPEEAPQTVRNFVKLARRGYFDGTAIHRVVPDFVIQDGDPTGTGWGGPGYTIRCEYNHLRYEPGMVGMALSGKDTGGSQWFVTQSAQPHLDGRYTIFAHVTRGMDVVQRTVQGDRVLKVTILE